MHVLIEPVKRHFFSENERVAWQLHRAKAFWQAAGRSHASPQMSARSFFAVVRIRAAAWQAGRPMREQQPWPEHAAFMNGLAASRFIVLGGPLGGGERVLHIVEAAREEMVRERFVQDPGERMSVLRTESAEPWNVLLDRDAAGQPRAD